jgi:predicted nucleotidyltransferase
MRLLETEKNNICSLLREIDPAGSIRLFGSRMDDSKRGGDIDIFFETSRLMNLKERLRLQYKLSSKCDVKVDLLVKTPEDDEMPIYEIARNGSLL